MATAYPSCHFAKEGETPWTKTQRQTTTLTFTSLDLLCM